MLKITIMCFSVKTICLLKNSKRTRESSLHQFSTKLTRAELVNPLAVFAGILPQSGNFCRVGVLSKYVYPTIMYTC